MLQVDWNGLLDYTPDNIEKYAENNGGVYRLSYVNNVESSKLIVFLVEGSRRLKDDLLQHFKHTEPTPCVKSRMMKNECFFDFAYLDETLIDGVERFLFETYEPECGLHASSQTPIPVNLN